MGSYESWLAGGGDRGRRQLAVLRLLGLFDRPGDDRCIGALRRNPVIPGLTEPLVNLDEADWNLTVSALSRCGLVAVDGHQHAIDTHPLIREYFAQGLRNRNPETWRTGHRRLYGFLKESTP